MIRLGSRKGQRFDMLEIETMIVTDVGALNVSDQFIGNIWRQQKYVTET